MIYKDNKNRCKWCNPKNELYIKYHDEEWGQPSYKDKYLFELLENPNIIRNKLKINAAINNSKIFKEIQKEYQTFSNYIWHFTDNNIVYEIDKTSSELSDIISKDLKKRGMKFVGTTIIYSYLQAIGVIYSHEEGCFLKK